MIKSIATFTCILAFSLACCCQITLNVQVPPGGVVLKTQLWNLTIISSEQQSEYVSIIVNVSNAKTGQLLMRGTSRQVMLSKGVKQLRIEDAEPVNYEYFDASFNGSSGIQNFMPAGNYLCCYVIMGSNGKSLLNEDCVTLDVEPLSPPILQNPPDEGVVETGCPQFTWLPPAPVSMFLNLTYEFRVSELKQGQSKTEAFQKNIPIYQTHNTKSLFEIYPASISSLDTAKQYVWGVIARSGNSYVIASDIYSFKVNFSIKSGISVSKNDTYVRMERNDGYSITAVSEILKVIYKNETLDKRVTCKIITVAENRIIKEYMLDVNVGDNFIEVETVKLHLKTGEVYRIEIVDGNNNMQALKFIYSK